jgi:PilZ domain
MPQAATPDAAVETLRADQRQSERRELTSWALVTALGTPAQIHRAQIRNLSEGGTQILLGEPLQPFTLLKIEYEDNLLLGEVIYCRPEEFGYLAGLRIEHALFGLTALSDAMQSF